MLLCPVSRRFNLSVSLAWNGYAGGLLIWNRNTQVEGRGGWLAKRDVWLIRSRCLSICTHLMPICKLSALLSGATVEKCITGCVNPALCLIGPCVSVRSSRKPVSCYRHHCSEVELRVINASITSVGTAPAWAATRFPDVS
jgi:hypothetical protein